MRKESLKHKNGLQEFIKTKLTEKEHTDKRYNMHLRQQAQKLKMKLKLKSKRKPLKP